MKNTILLTLLGLTTLFSQAQIQPVEEINDEMSQGINRGFKILVPEASEKATIKAWQKMMKQCEGTTEKVKKAPEYKSSNVSIPTISEQPITLFTTFQETPEGIYLTSFLILDDLFLNSDMHPKKVEVFKQTLSSFATQIAKQSAQEKLDEETKTLNKLEKEMSKLKKEQASSEDAIKAAEETIAKSKKILAENAAAQQKKSKEVAKQKVKQQEVKSTLENY